jgi:hypothetical protein
MITILFMRTLVGKQRHDRTDVSGAASMDLETLMREIGNPNVQRIFNAYS